MLGRIFLVGAVAVGAAGSMLARGAAAADNKAPAWRPPQRLGRREPPARRPREAMPRRGGRRQVGRCACPTTPARSGANTTSVPTRPASRAPSGPSRRSSTGFSARRATRRGTPSRWASSASATARSASTIRPKCRRSWPTLSSDSPAARRPRTRFRCGWSRSTVPTGGPRRNGSCGRCRCKPRRVNAWVLPKENAAILLGELRRRSDYREHSSPYLMVNNGQSTVVSAMRGRPYVRDVIPRPDTAAGFDPSPGQVDEGFALRFQPAAVGRPPDDRRHDQVRDRPGREDDSGDDRRAHADLAAAADEDRGAADDALPLPRAVPLADRSGVGGGDGHGGAADPGRRRPAGAGRAAADRQYVRRGPICWCSSSARGNSAPAAANSPARLAQLRCARPRTIAGGISRTTGSNPFERNSFRSEMLFFRRRLTPLKKQLKT